MRIVRNTILPNSPRNCNPRMDATRPPPRTPIPAAAGTPGDTAEPVDSATLLRGFDEVVIRHNGRDYRLRRTRLGKLILTA